MIPAIIAAARVVAPMVMRGAASAGGKAAVEGGTKSVIGAAVKEGAVSGAKSSVMPAVRAASTASRVGSMQQGQSDSNNNSYNAYANG
jgi:formylmethanofuran dehydrogenase subunit C